MRWSIVNLPILLAGISSYFKYQEQVAEKIHKSTKDRQERMSEKLQWWNQVKFRECCKVEWSVGLLGSYIELACLEGRPIENINYCFPPKELPAAKKQIFGHTEVIDLKADVDQSEYATEKRDGARTPSTDDSCSSEGNSDANSDRNSVGNGDGNGEGTP